MASRELFLFPLPQVVLYPGTVKPLNIFEPRYIKMIHDSMRTETPIALGHVDEPGRHVSTMPGRTPDFVRQVAGYGMPVILEEREDGSLLVLIQGQGKAHINEIKDAREPYLVVDAEPLAEIKVLDPAASATVGELRRMLFGWIMRHVPDTSQQQHFIESVKSPEEVLGCLASFMVRDADMQQYLLEESEIRVKSDILRRLVQSSEFRSA